MAKITENGKFAGFKCEICNADIKNENKSDAYKLLIQHLKTVHTKKDQPKTATFQPASELKPTPSLEERITALEKTISKLRQAMQQQG
jgi:hypothetical protein